MKLHFREAVNYSFLFHALYRLGRQQFRTADILRTFGSQGPLVCLLLRSETHPYSVHSGSGAVVVCWDAERSSEQPDL